VTHAEAKPHIDPKAAPITTAISGGPRSILYPYMLQHSLFPSLLFKAQRSIGHGLDAFRPTPESLSITHRLELLAKSSPSVSHVPIYLIYGDSDTAVQRFDKTVDCLKGASGELEIEVRPGLDHAFDEDESEECIAFREWLGRTLI
jgi:predicted esterase